MENNHICNFIWSSKRFLKGISLFDHHFIVEPTWDYCSKNATWPVLLLLPYSAIFKIDYHIDSLSLFFVASQLWTMIGVKKLVEPHSGLEMKRWFFKNLYSNPNINSHTMLQKLSKCEVKAWLCWNSIILLLLRFCVKSHFGEFKLSKNVIYGNFGDAELWILVNLGHESCSDLLKIKIQNLYRPAHPNLEFC